MPVVWCGLVEQQSPHEQVNTLGLHVPDGKGLTLVSNSQKSIQILQMATRAAQSLAYQTPASFSI